jgi:hypothetical protein
MPRVITTAITTIVATVIAASIAVGVDLTPDDKAAVIAADPAVGPRPAPVTIVPAVVPPTIAVQATPDLTLLDATAEDRAALNVALADFRAAGLDLPNVEIVYSDDEAACEGHLGIFDQRAEPWRITICSDLDFVIAHELAHAWTAANLDDTDRSRYTTARGLTNWADHDTPWNERATEDAAFIIQQNLTMQHVPLSSPTWLERIDAYELLTGRPSPLQSDPQSTNQTSAPKPTRHIRRLRLDPPDLVMT